MDLKSYLRQIPSKELRDDFARRSGTSLGFLKLIAYNAKTCSPELAAAIDRESGGLVSYRQLCPEPKMDWSYVEQKAILSACKAVNKCVRKTTSG